MDIAATRTPPPLHDLLGVSFVFNAPINALAWDGDHACFGLADGAVAMMAAHWPGAPHLAPRPGGGLALVPSAAPPPPPAIVGAHCGPVLALAADPLGGVVSGGADGKFLRLAGGGITLLAERARRRIGVVAAGRGGRRSFAAGRQVDRVGPDAKRLTLPGAVTALAFDSSGLHLAAGYQGGVSLEACAVRTAPRQVLQGACRLLCWNHDGSMVGAAGAGPAVAVRRRADDTWIMIALDHRIDDLAFSRCGTLVIASAAGLQIWQAEDGMRPMSVGRHADHCCGPIACHPRIPLVACADQAGRVLLRHPRLGDTIVVRDAGAAPVALAFAPDGEALAFAASDGEAGTVILPAALFRTGEREHE
jgi:hypothetical protein